MAQKLKVLWNRKFWFIPKSADYPPYEMIEVNQVDDKSTFCKGCNTTRNTLAYYQDLGLERARFEFDENLCLVCSLDDDFIIITKEIGASD
jgi:hypothetical protein